ncbi:MAG: arylsulfatase [Mariniblastus sp.]
MYRFRIVLAITAILSFQCLAASADSNGSVSKPNIVVILADDLGFGDVQPNNPESKIPTPAFNQLAKQGVRFTDAHSGSGVCTPTRYGLVCGRYAWRTHLKRGVLGGYSKPLIKSDQQTIASVLSEAGYQTCCVGKWHLGLGWQWKKATPDNINFFGIAGEKGMVDYEKPITDGPTTHGFHESYIIPASLDMSPYVYIRNDRVTAMPNEVIKGAPFPKFYRKGETAPDFKHVQCLTHLLGQATSFIERESKTDKPFFLYFPMPAPHKPIIPEQRFQGTTKLGTYGDFVAQVDWTVGEILKKLDETKMADNTLLLVTSDNGSFMHRYDSTDIKDHLDDESIQGFRPTNHTANGKLRGTKADVWEAGHRVPFFCRLPKPIDSKLTIPAGETCDRTTCLTDILATTANAAGASFDSEKSPDSFSFLGDILAEGGTSETRPMVINHSSSGMFAIRDGKWKLVLGNGSGGRQKPKGKPFGRPYHLFDLDADIGETENLIDKHSEIKKKLLAEFERIAAGDQLPVKKKSNK